MGQASVTAAVITASVAVLVAVIAQVSTWTLEHRHRVYERRRAALLDVQDAAVHVRSALRRLAASLESRATQATSADALAPPQDAGTGAEVEDAAALLALRLARVESVAVRAAVNAWHDLARYSSFLEEASRPDAQVAWNAMNQLIAGELTVPGWWRRRLRAGAG